MINDTRQQPAIHGVRTVRYIGETEFNLPLGTKELDLDLALIKYYNLSGKAYYDDNENGRPDGAELNENVTIHFNGPLDFTVITNSSGWYYRYVLAGEYCTGGYR